MRRSCGDTVEILLKKPLHQDFEDPVRWCLYEKSLDLMSSFIQIYTKGPAAAVAIMV